jgi:hypothetical protein
MIVTHNNPALAWQVKPLAPYIGITFTRPWARSMKNSVYAWK